MKPNVRRNRPADAEGRVRLTEGLDASCRLMLDDQNINIASLLQIASELNFVPDMPKVIDEEHELAISLRIGSNVSVDLIDCLSHARKRLD